MNNPSAVDCMAAAFICSVADDVSEFDALPPELKLEASGPAPLEDKSLLDLLPHLTEKERRFLHPAPLKGLYGGRAARKSHFMAELMLALMIKAPDLQCVVIRKYRASITNSAQLLLKNKIHAMGWDGLFESTGNTIRRKGGRGFIAFTGMQDHNATSIKSYENFAIAWVEEATELDQYSLELLTPTFRRDDSEVWFTWNPDQPTDAIDVMLRQNPPDDAIVEMTSFKENIFLSDKSKRDEQESLRRDPEKHAWIWLGGYNVKSDAIIFSGYWRVAEVDIKSWDGPYLGGDWGFSVDPTVATESWISGNQIYVRRESYEYQLPTDKISARWQADIEGIEQEVVRADNARPENINLVKRTGIRRIVACKKWTNCVEDGIDWLKNYEILVDPSCVNTQEEFKRYRYRITKGGNVTRDIVDSDNHAIDSIRYSFEPLIKLDKTELDLETLVSVSPN